MISLTELTQKYKLLLIIIFLIVLIAALIYLAISKNTAPSGVNQKVTPPQITQNPSQKRPGVVDITQIQAPSSIPKELPIFNIQKSIITDAISKNAALTFGINAAPFLVEQNTTDGTQYNWDQNGLVLTLSQSSLRYENKKKSAGQELSLLGLQGVAGHFIQSLPLVDKGFALNNQKTKYLKRNPKGPLVGVGSFELAEVIELSFDKTINEIPVVSRTSEKSYLTLMINKVGIVEFLTYRHFAGLSQQGLYKLKSINDSLVEVRNGQGIIVRAAMPDEFGYALEPEKLYPVDINTLKIISVKLGYFLPENFDEILQPVFVFEGEFEKGGKRGRVIIYLPAIKT